MSTICTTLAVAVGVTGHRRIPDDQRTRIEKQVAEILAQIKTALADPKDYWEGFEGDAVLRVVSCLADGADQLVAHAGLAQGYQLEAVIPFPRTSEVHRQDRTDGQQSLNNFDRLVAQAEHVLELAPDYSNDLPWDSEEAKVKRTRGYELASLRMLDYCDVLIAIWDGKPSDRSSSSARVVELARKQQIPVFWINPTDPNHKITVLFHSEKPDLNVDSILRDLLTLEKPDGKKRGGSNEEAISLYDYFKERRKIKPFWSRPFRWIDTKVSRSWRAFFRILAPGEQDARSRRLAYTVSNDIAGNWVIQ